jgi:hypothetical protein
MADHINIQHPDYRGVESQTYRSMLENEKLKLELKQLRQWYDTIERDLDSIFTRTERGEKTELHYPDGRVYIISGVERE